MKQKAKKWISFLLAIVLIAGLVPNVRLPARAASTGESVWWMYDEQTKSLHIRDFAWDGYQEFTAADQKDVATGQKPRPWAAYRNDCTLVKIENNLAPAETGRWFENFSMLTKILNLDHLDTSAVTNMGGMFSNCTSLTSLDLSSFDTAQVKVMTAMFYECTSLASLDLSSFDTAQVETMFCMFYHCTSLTSLDLRSFDVRSDADIASMFAECADLTTIYTAPYADWSGCANTDGMFYDCYSLEGGMGTHYLPAFKNGDYARVDQGVSCPGYFTPSAAIQLGTGRLATKVNTAKAATVYFGTYNTTPIAWRVIGYDGEGAAGKFDGITLLAAGGLDSSSFAVDASINGYGALHNYLRPAVEKIADKLTNAEMLAVQKRTLSPGHDEMDGDTVYDALMWPLSVGEAERLDQTLRATGSEWWLRTAGDSIYVAAYVDIDGGVNTHYSSNNNLTDVKDVRPAVSLRLGSVLFISAAKDGKTADGALLPVEHNYTDDWKLTVLDGEENEFNARSTISGNDVVITCNDGKPGSSETRYISAIIKNGAGAVTYYGRLKSYNGPGSQTVTVKNVNEKLGPGDTLYVFREVYNGDYMTDYASALVPVLSPGLQFGTDALETTLNTATAPTVEYMATINGNVQVINWRVIGCGNRGGSVRQLYWNGDTPSGMSNGALTLLADQGLGSSQFSKDAMSYYGHIYSSSELLPFIVGLSEEPSWSKPFYAYGCILPRVLGGYVVYDGGDPLGLDGIAGSSVSDNIMWPLSTREAAALDPSLRETGSAWWLRSPGIVLNDTYRAAYVSAKGAVDGRGEFVDEFLDVRPAFQLPEESILFACAPNTKKGVDGSFHEVARSMENTWRLTLMQNNNTISRPFSAAITALEGDKLTIAWMNAETGEDMCLSAYWKDSNGVVTHYGQLVSLEEKESDRGSFVVDVSGLDLNGKTLCVFYEQSNNGGADFACRPIELPAEQTACSVRFALTELETDGAPFATLGKNYTATLTVENPTEYLLPDEIEVKAGDTVLTAGKDYAFNASTGEFTLYASAITGNITITAAAVAKTFVISADTNDVTFADAGYNYTTAPDAKTVTITNIGTGSVTLVLILDAPNFEVGTLSAGALAPGEDATFTVRPRLGLNVGNHTGAVVIEGINGTYSCEIPVSLSFKVLPVYTVTYAVEGGSFGDDDLTSEQVYDGNKPASVPTGMTPDTAHKDSGAWYKDNETDPCDPSNTAITDDTTFTYKFTPKTQYTVTSGADGIWTKGSGLDYTLTVKRNVDDDTCFSHFTGVQIGSTTLTAGADYEVKAGSTVITLKAAALQKLGDGSHTVTVNFDDGTATTSLTVKDSGGQVPPPQTGDDSNPMLWTALMTLSLIGLGGVMLVGRKRRTHS
ncbi:MAG: BspA family leucine-rich repeat surface protein [Clostridia bacterium]|nr:BspA family leucine-rich repeat surface protein [Clostridia bacterium]